MCGIVGYFGKDVKKINPKFEVALKSIAHRGPDDFQIEELKEAILGHVRLSIIDLSSGKQPMTDSTNQYHIIFNGEIYNYLVLKEELQQKGVVFQTFSDTEVLLQGLITEGKEFLKKINGFFAFCFYDSQSKKTLIARDRFGIKPLFYSQQTDGCLLVSSELSGITKLSDSKDISIKALTEYFRFNYIPAPLCIYKNVFKLLPGHLIEYEEGSLSIEKYYSLPSFKSKHLSFEEAKNEMKSLMQKSVDLRLVADVEVGTFLSGGIDSSIVSALAAKKRNGIRTFSMGFSDNPFYDETAYALAVSEKIKSNHTVYQISEKDLLNSINHHHEILSEPFADSSSLAVFELSKKVSKEVKVVLSGDGADEVYAGYRKHLALFNADQTNIKNTILKSAGILLDILPEGRSSKFLDLARKAKKYSSGLNLSNSKRYWRWASIQGDKALNDLLLKPFLISRELNYKEFKSYLQEDVEFVLPNDMLTKVDLMSMANGLEVRTPFLDHEIVEYAFKLPESFLLNSKNRKVILQEAFRDDLPESLFNRPKKGFEVPLINWFKGELKQELNKYVFNEKLITDQNLFNYSTIEGLREKLYSKSAGDAPATIWALFIFNYWWINKHNA